MGFSIKKFFKDNNDENVTENGEDDFYSVDKDDANEEARINGNNVILLEKLRDWLLLTGELLFFIFIFIFYLKLYK